MNGSSEELVGRESHLYNLRCWGTATPLWAIGEIERLEKRVGVLRKAAETGLEWAIDAANEINDERSPVFKNAMRDVRLIEAALKEGGGDE